MAIAALLQRSVFRDARRLAERGKRVKLPKDRNDRPALACLANHGRRDACRILGDPKALRLKHALVLGDRLKFIVERLRRIEDTVGQFDKTIAVAVDMIPDRIGVLHHSLHDSLGRVRASHRVPTGTQSRARPCQPSIRVHRDGRHLSPTRSGDGTYSPAAGQAGTGFRPQWA